MSLDRLLDLSRRTGKQLIVYDRYGGNDMVILSVDEYESMLTGDERQDIRSLTERELLDQINRDIAVWRVGQESETVDFEEENSGGQEDVAVPHSWHSAASVLQKRPITDVVAPLVSRPLHEEEKDPGDEEEVVTQPIPYTPGEETEKEKEGEPLAAGEPIFYEEPV